MRFSLSSLVFILLLISGQPSLNGADKLPWLKADGTKIVDEQGKTVILRGINIGGWLVEEMWMMPFKTTSRNDSHSKPIKDHSSLWKTVEKRFGQKKMRQIRTELRSVWFTDSDFARIRDAGFNCVRLPFLYDLMEEPDGLFVWLDRAIAAADKYGIYVILDMHGAPGRQSNANHTGEANHNHLFSDHANVRKTAEIWAKIAKRYKNRATVAGYDLINEPMGTPNSSMLYLVTDQIYRAIRTVDTGHLIFIEDGYKGIEGMPYPHALGWDNIVLSTHSYPGARSGEGYLEHLKQLMETITQQQILRKVPYYLGEFNVAPHGTAEELKKFITLLTHKEFSWSIWTYKDGKNKSSLWGLYVPSKQIKRIDLFRDSEAQILKKIRLLGTENFEKNKELAKILKG